MISKVLTVLTPTGSFPRTLLVFLLFGCGAPDQDEYEGDNDGFQAQQTTLGQNSNQQDYDPMIMVPINLTSNLGGLSLASATAFTISLDSCTSGHTATATEVNAGLRVYKYDKSCLAKLTTFTYNGDVLIPTAGDPFTTWQAGDTATFDISGGDGTKARGVEVVSTLQDPIAGTESILYQFTELVLGADESVSQTTTSTDQTITVDSFAPPSFTIKQVDLVGISGTDAGQFNFLLECTVSIGVSDACNSVNFVDTKYKLIEDTYSGILNQTEADALFPTGENAITLPGDRVAPGALGTVNGGFVSITLDGPADMVTNPNMILILQSNDKSYQYFNIDVVLTTTN